MACADEKPLEDVVAEVSGSYFLRKDLAAQIPPTASREDSVKRAKTIINNWVKEQVVLNKAKFNIPDDERINALLEDYKNDLLIYEYENQLVKQELDTSVTEEQMLLYYDENKENFILRDVVARMRYMVLPAELDEVGKLKRKFFDYKPKDSLDVHELADEEALKFLDKPSEWIIVQTVLKDIPYELEAFEKKMKRDKYFEIEKDGKLHLFYIHEYNFKDGVSPFQFEKERIKNTLINQRKIALLESMRSALFQEALEKGEIKLIE